MASGWAAAQTSGRRATTFSDVTLVYDTPDPGTSKTLTPVAATIEDGAGGANYDVTFVPNTSSSILPPFRNADITGQTVYDVFVRYEVEAVAFFTDYWWRVLDMWETPTWRIKRRGSQAAPAAVASLARRSFATKSSTRRQRDLAKISAKSRKWEFPDWH